MVTLPCDTRVRLGNEAVELGASQVSTVSTVFCGVVGTIITLFYHRRNYNTVTLRDLPQAAQPVSDRATMRTWAFRALDPRVLLPRANASANCVWACWRALRGSEAHAHRLAASAGCWLSSEPLLGLKERWEGGQEAGALSDGEVTAAGLLGARSSDSQVRGGPGTCTEAGVWT